MLAWVVPAGERRVAEGELAEGFAVRVRDDGIAAARRWYVRQVWGFAWRAVMVRRLIGTGEGEAMNGLGDLGGDVRWAVRTLRSRPSFAAVAVVTLALGMGANTAIFTLVNAHFLVPLPWERPDELVLIWETAQNSREVTTVSPGNYWTWRDEAESFEEVAAFNVDFATLSGDGIAERVTASVVSPHYFEVLGIEPVAGAGFDASTVQAEGVQQVVLSHSLWVRRYGADPALIGRDIRINGVPHTVMGVLPASFRQPERSLSWQATEIWRPMLLEELRTDFGSRYLRTVARLRPGATIEQARTEVESIAARLAGLYPESNAGRTALVYTLDEYLLGDARPTLILLLVAGAAVLLIVCANVANLTLARGQERRREFAVRAALGSGRGRLVRQVLVESVSIALLGAAVGTVFVVAGTDVLQSMQTRYFSGFVDVVVDWRVVLLTAAAALAAALLFALPLARSASRPQLRGALGEGGARSGWALRRSGRASCSS